MPTKLITGQPGNGKTLYAVHLIKQALKEGREVYTNINGIKLDVLPIPENDKGELDWTLTPKGDAELGIKGALIVYDETQKLSYFAYKSKEKLSSNPLITELETHRHHGYDLIFITQSPKFLHLHLLDLVNEHYHVKRPFNKKQAEIHLHRKACMLPETEAAEKRAEDIFKFEYPPELFKEYKSTEIVTNSKLRIPTYMKRLMWIVGLSVVGIIYLVFFRDNFIFGHMMGKDKKNEVAAQNVPAQKADEESNKKIDEACAKQYGMTVEQCADLRDPSKRNNELQATNDVRMSTISVNYNPNKPYDVELPPDAYEVTSKPIFSGCMKKNGHYVAYTQQGTILHDVSETDCKRLMKQAGDRPFNYFAKSNNEIGATTTNMNTNTEVKNAPVEKVEQKQQPVQYAENYIQRGLERDPNWY
ncbi:hypothetical protein C7G80_18325 [Acinetobacter nosocomialis]|uniref:zonular occludens toxin domain-containing protein n=1 Tax=Acinetobacter nosocomialis TaxID=106654 RepID=UPI000D1119C8|nr:zonular occludens toxin domain-containing protein [Acinetobacter nosocomialis]PSD65979.1 hypothetical protein C7G80_18325 [Acinetobacter nosocomialis]